MLSNKLKPIIWILGIYSLLITGTLVMVIYKYSLLRGENSKLLNQSISTDIGNSINSFNIERCNRLSHEAITALEQAKVITEDIEKNNGISQLDSVKLQTFVVEALTKNMECFVYTRKE